MEPAPSFCIVPKYIVQDPRLTSQDKITLAVLARDPGVGNRTLAERAGVAHKHPQEVHRQLRQLERKGLITRDGGTRGRRLAVPTAQQQDNRPLHIPPEILHDPRLNATQKLLAASRLQFQHFDVDDGWHARRTGTSRRSQLYNDRLKSYNFCPGNPITFVQESYNFCPASFKNRERTEKNRRGYEYPLERPAGAGDGQMDLSGRPVRKAHTEPPSAATRSPLESQRKEIRRQLARKKPPKPLREAPAWACQELERWMARHPDHARQYRPGCQSYHDAAMVIVHLSKSLAKSLPNDLLKSIRATMMAKGHGPRQVDHFLNAVLDVGARTRLLDALAHRHSKEYGNGGGRADLAQALCSYRQHYCLLMPLFLRPPVPLPEQAPPLAHPDVGRAVEDAQAMCKDGTAATRAELVRKVNTLWREHDRVWARELRGSGLEWEYGRFLDWWEGLVGHSIEGLARRHGAARASWFGLNTVPVQSWVRELRRRLAA